MRVPTLHSALLLTPSLAAALSFYSGALGLPAVHAGAGWARLSLGGGASLLLQEVASSSAPAPGGGAVLQFSAGDAFDTLLPTLLQAGGVLDSPVQFAPAGKLAVLRAPAAAGGHTLTLREEELAGAGAAAPARLA